MVLGYYKISCSYFTLDSEITLPLALLNIFHLLPNILSYWANQTTLDALTKYNTLSARWLELQYLYPEHSTFRPVDLPLHYIQGLGSNSQFLQEELCLLSSLKSDDPLALLTASCSFSGPRTNRSTNSIHLHSATAMSSTTPDIFPVSASDIAHTLDRALDGQICTDQHPIHALIVSAIQRAWISNPHGLCSYTWCGVKHDPLCCCICFGSNHKTIDCWHFNGLCDNRKELFIKAVMITTF